jgi:hypothetical protein
VVVRDGRIRSDIPGHVLSPAARKQPATERADGAAGLLARGGPTAEPPESTTPTGDWFCPALAGGGAIRERKAGGGGAAVNPRWCRCAKDGKNRIELDKKKTALFTADGSLVEGQNSLIKNMLDESCDRRKQNKFLLFR